ncbi:hypothetical protein N7468_001006 [Penicillium chermesinum]|uniref:HNH nuclease domain-containing protein n=1 Tax=Penicillium chermesinum TaxID=63820 RepID=A0A9W9TWX0_9EURO|nr:uncharacterized protein N7468_001006 [Penicillium chermesinum]KAJ5246023.1 hypothetical protein N7468_001006 [Penicillium chermesinum]KAJ6144319.1 hypothetical protein N7470_008214 [Penicillium chermesinum]
MEEVLERERDFCLIFHIFPLEKERIWVQNNFSQFITNTDSGNHAASINSVQNGLLLQSTVHGLFDTYSISVNPDDKLARKHAQESFSEPLIHLIAGLTNPYIPTVRGTLSLQGIDGNVGETTCKINAQMIFDTGAGYTTVAEELLPESFRRYLQDPIHDPYRSADGVICQVEAQIALSNRSAVSTSIASITPASRMPNGFVGVLFGQNTCINRLNIQLTPRSVLIAKGEDISDSFWGDITISEYVDVTGVMIPL